MNGLVNPLVDTVFSFLQNSTAMKLSSNALT
jgi:hypothetical protein